MSGSISLKSITGVQIGKQSEVALFAFPYFLMGKQLCNNSRWSFSSQIFNSSVGKLALADRVLTVESTDGQVNVEAKTSSQLTAWLLLLTVLLKIKGSSLAPASRRTYFLAQLRLISLLLSLRSPESGRGQVGPQNVCHGARCGCGGGS